MANSSNLERTEKGLLQLVAFASEDLSHWLWDDTHQEEQIDLSVCATSMMTSG